MLTGGLTVVSTPSLVRLTISTLLTLGSLSKRFKNSWRVS